MPPRVRVVVLWTLAVVAAAIIAWMGRSLFAPFLWAAVLAYLLAPAVNWAEGEGLRRGAAILVVYAACGLVAGAIAAWFFPLLVEQLQAFALVLPEYTARILDAVRAIRSQYSNPLVPDGLRDTVDDFLAGLGDGLLGSVRGALDALPGVLGILVRAALVPILTYYILRDLPGWLQEAQRRLPEHVRTWVVDLGRDVDRVLSGFLHGQVLVSAIVGSLVAIVLAVLGVPFFALWGLLAFVTNFIPYFGAFLGAAPAVITASLSSWTLAVQVALAYTAVQQVEASLISPRIVGTRVGLHPLAVVFVLLAGTSALGWVGALVGVPVAAVLRVVVLHSLRLRRRGG